ncbi:MAG: alpha/beta hydrolase [Clostridia bacterium]|nr:alpha/beta hydrolase [Clostridia bacterium]
MVLIIILLALVFLFAAAVTVFFFYTFVRKNKESRVIFKAGDEAYFGKHYKAIAEGANYIMSQQYEEHYIKSYDGLTLYGRYLKNGDSKKTVMLFHGYRSCGEKDFSGSFKYLVDSGFNILLVDQRSHEKSEGKIISFGVKESRDVITWLEYLLKTYGDDKKVFLEGLSMGAATVLFSARFDMPENVKGIIADCGFDSPERIIRKVAKQNFRINGFLLMPLLDQLCRLFGKFSVYEVTSEDALKNFKKPVLLIHGTGDAFVPCEMSKASFEAANEPKFICLVDGAMHGMSYLVDTPKVQKAFNEFIEFCEKQ